MTPEPSVADESSEAGNASADNENAGSHPADGGSGPDTEVGDDPFHVAPFDGRDERLDAAGVLGGSLAVPARRLLAALVATPSVSGEEDRVAETLAAFFAAHGRSVSRDDAGNVRAPADDAVLLTSHLDTVPGEVGVGLESESAPPWGGAPVLEDAGDAASADGESGADDESGADGETDADDETGAAKATDGVPVLRGRGSVDATSALAAMAAVAVSEGVSFAGVVSEETDAAGARHLVADRDAPRTVINGEPSGWDAVTLAYRGLTKATYRVERPGTHGSRPTANATQLATGWWNRVERAFAAEGPVVERVTATPTAFDGGREGNHSVARVTASFRVPVGVDPATVQQAVEGVTRHGTLSWEAAITPAAASPRVAPARALRGAIRASGGEPRHLRKTGTADTNHYAAAWDAPVVTYGPGDSGLDHAPDERIALPEFDRSVAVLADAVERLR